MGRHESSRSAKPLGAAECGLAFARPPREGEVWVVYRLAPGKRVRASDLIIPSEVQPSEIATYLDDLFHAAASPGKSVRLLP